MFAPPPQPRLPDYYEILGVGPQSSPQEIKAAYRKLSFKFHPDKNKDPGAQEIFQAISSAYETLSDEQKRQQYDFERMHPGARMHMGGGGGGGGGGEQELNEFLNMVFGGFPGMMRHGPVGAGGGIHVFNMSGGFPQPPPQGAVPPPIFEELFGSGGIHMRMKEPTVIPIIVKEISLTMEQCFTGCTVPVEISRQLFSGAGATPNVELETIYVDIPRGIDHNETIVIREKGNARDGRYGDLKLIAVILPHSQFERTGLDICLKKTVTLKEALLGATISFQHLNGKNYNLTSSPEIIQPGMRRRFQGLGMMRGEHQGDFWLEFGIEFPVTLTPEQREALLLGLPP